MASYDISKIITSLDSAKKTSGVIPTNAFKLANKEVFKGLADCINECIKKNEFPKELKAADITPIFKKENPLDKESV